MNEVNLNAFPFEYDLTWMSFFQNWEGKTYARYGGREDSGPETQLTRQSLIKTMERVLTLHKNGAVKPWSKYDPEPGKRFTPPQIPTMKGLLAKRKVKCIHCHDVKNATLYDRMDHGLLKKDDIFTYPSPKQLGIILNADNQVRVDTVASDSAAANAGLKSGDIVETIDNQRVLTFADFTRVLELAPENGNLQVTATRSGEKKDLQLKLTKGWKRSDDPSWRPSTSAIGPNSGFWAKSPGVGELKKAGANEDDLALKIVVVWGAWAKKAGLKNGDIVLEIDGLKNRMTIRQLQTHLQLNHDYGDEIKLVVYRSGRRREITMTLPASGERH